MQHVILSSVRHAHTITHHKDTATHKPLGAVVGSVVGLWDGEVVGSDDGAVVGRPDGTLVGNSVGLLVIRVIKEGTYQARDLNAFPSEDGMRLISC